jgi:signal transduction histidine kinase/ActR/RegA family two-component response regulator
LLALFALVLVAPAARGDTPDAITPLQLARAIEARAAATSFTELEAFAVRAETLRGQERLNRLHHAAWVLLREGEPDKSALINQRLMTYAGRDGSQRYVLVARLNALHSRLIDGADEEANEIRRIVATERDWFVRVHAMRLLALDLQRRGKVAPALAMLGEAEALIPQNQPFAGTALAGVWEVRALLLKDVQDLNGATRAWWKSEFVHTDPEYPRPDFDPLYYMGQVAARLGDLTLAQALYEAHHRLAVRANVPALNVMDLDFCAAVAESQDNPRGVIACIDKAPLQKVGRMLDHTLPMRALAYARLGRVAEARADLARLRQLETSGVIPASPVDKLNRIEAEILLAEGRPEAAFAKFREHYITRFRKQSQTNSAGMAQFTADVDQQLDERRRQAATALSNADLQARVIRLQQVAIAVGFLFLITIMGLLVWQLRVGLELRAARHRAEAANRAKSEFLANMSHEIRTPLNGVLAMADMLSRAKLSPRDRELADIIRNSGETLEKLLSDILDLARVEAGRMELDEEPFHLGDLVRAVAQLSHLKAQEKGLELSVIVEPAADRHFQGDPLRLRQVITNLVSNAIKFTERGSVRIEAARSSTGGIVLKIIDTGIGFTNQQKEQLFGRFRQGDGSITRRFGGSGLGLSISRRLTDLMGGRLTCESEPGEGAEFRLEVDLPEVDVRPAADVVTSGRQALDARNLKVLLADDHPTNRKVVELILMDEGVDLTSVEDGEKAVAAFSTEVFDIVLMDMQMPVMDGLTAVREIRRLEAARGGVHTPILMLTANALPEHVAASAEAGADGHVSKPISPRDLFDAMNGALDGGAAQREAAA